MKFSFLTRTRTLSRPPFAPRSFGLSAVTLLWAGALAMAAPAAAAQPRALPPAQPQPSLPRPTPPPSASAIIRVPASVQQHMLVAQVVGAQVLVRVCPAGGSCTPAGGEGETFPINPDAAPSSMRSEVFSVSRDMRVLLLSFAARQGRGRWSLLIAATPRKQPPTVTKLLSGFVNRPRGVVGSQRTSALWTEAAAGGSRITVARSYDNATVCGRRAWLSVRELSADTLSWQAAPSRSLHPDDRASAVPLQARRSKQPYQTKHIRVLRAEVVSNAAEPTRGTIVDGKLSTRWAEARAGDGSGEFVSLSAVKQLDIRGLSLAFRLPEASPLKGAAPRHFFIATPEKIFRVTMPEDAWTQPVGTAYEVDFPAPLLTNCVALVLDDAYPHDDNPVGVAELRARTAFDELNGDYNALVVKLDDPALAEQAKQLLLRGGERALKASMTGYAGLSAAGRVAALVVIDAGDCRTTAPFFVERLLGEGAGADFDPDIDKLAAHARDRLRGCLKTSAPLLVAAMVNDVGKRRGWAAEQLALMSPVEAARAIPAQLSEPQPDVRLQLRKALAMAAKHRRAKPVLETLLADLAFAKRPLVARIDILRALGDDIGQYRQAGAALAAIVVSDDSFRTRYLLLSPAAQLAATGDAHGLRLLEANMRSYHNPHMRAEAARVAGAVDALSVALEHSMGDAHPRVRAAALNALSDGPRRFSANAMQRALGLLKGDPWTFVRAEAASAVGAQPPDARLDEALVEALDDSAWPVRQAVLRALGRRNSAATAPRILEMAGNAKESTDVRAAAIAALGELCYLDASSLLYKLALRAARPQLPYDQPLGLAALSALGDIKPPDLTRRLAPLLARDRRIPRVIRSIARDTLGRRGRCMLRLQKDLRKALLAGIDAELGMSRSSPTVTLSAK